MVWTPMSAVLFGTAKGDIMETEIQQDSNPYIKQVSIYPYIKQVGISVH